LPDRAVIGRGRFPVSASVEAACKFLDPSGTPGCSGIRRDLSAMAEETRDPTWAPEMESRLQNFLETQRPDFSVRNIECRTSWCAIEVVSMDGNYFVGAFPYGYRLNAQLVASYHYALGTETDPTGVKFIVTLQTYMRK
jgi:hypothetical protein